MLFAFGFIMTRRLRVYQISGQTENEDIPRLVVEMPPAIARKLAKRLHRKSIDSDRIYFRRSATSSAETVVDTEFETGSKEKQIIPFRG